MTTIVICGVIAWCLGWLSWDIYADVHMIERRHEKRHRLAEQRRRDEHPEYYRKYSSD